MQPRTALVTGATGFIGTRLVPALLSSGWEVRAMTRRPEAYDGPGEAVGSLVPGDPIPDADAVRRALRERQR